MLLLDTNVVSELRKVHSGRTDPNFTVWSMELEWADLFLSAITIYELELGISRLENYDSTQGTVLRTWFREKVLPAFDGRVLPVNREIALLSAQLQLSRTRQLEDTLIAATAQIHRMTVVTRNVGDFADAGVGLVNPWQAVAR